MSMMSVPSVGALGDTCPSLEQLQGIYDPSDPCQGGGVVSGGYDPSGGGSSGGGSTDWATIIANMLRGIDSTLAITQGGSVTPTGVYGSAGTASIAASGYPAAGIGAGVGSIFNSPVILLGIVGIVLVMASKK